MQNSEEDIENLLKKSVSEHPLVIELSKFLIKALSQSTMYRMSGEELKSNQIKHVIDNFTEQCLEDINEAQNHLKKFPNDFDESEIKNKNIDRNVPIKKETRSSKKEDFFCIEISDVVNNDEEDSVIEKIKEYIPNNFANLKQLFKTTNTIIIDDLTEEDTKSAFDSLIIEDITLKANKYIKRINKLK